MSRILYPFWSKNDRRLRAFWRILIHLGVWLVLASIIFISAGFLADFTASDNLNPLWLDTVSSLAPLISMIIAIYFMAASIDRRSSITDFGMQMSSKWWSDLGFGLLLGIVMMTFIFVTELALGWVTIRETFYVRNGMPFPTAIASAAILFLCVGIYEELLSRGYHLRNMAEGLRFINPRRAVLLAWILSSTIFGVLHAANPNASVLSTVSITLAGLLLGLPILLTGRLGAAIGLHITWNFAQGNIFGFPVSGYYIRSSIPIDVSYTGRGDGSLHPGEIKCPILGD